MALMPSTSMAVDFVPEGGRGTMSSISRSRLRALAIEIWRFDFDNFQALIDRRNSSARKLIMYLTQELAIPRRAGLEWPELRTYPPLRWTPQILSSAYIKKEPVSTSLAGSHVQEPARLAVRSISYRD